MQLIPANIWEQYSAVLKKRAVPVTRHTDYRKWLRYYLDFRSKYPLPDSKSEQVRLFIQKLREKKQTPEQQKQAAHALSLYFEILRKIDNKSPLAQINTEKTLKATSPSTPFIKGENLSRTEAGQRTSSRSPDSSDFGQVSIMSPSAGNRFNEWRCLAKSASPAWDKVIGNLAAGYAGVFLEDQLEKKYPKAAKDFIWQWFFPQQSLTFVAEKKERRRYHLNGKHVQEMLYEAVRRAKLTKRVTSHTFRHSFTTHLLHANYDIRTIQTLLGHSDVRTTMIYTHCVPSRTLKEMKSPLDF